MADSIPSLRRRLGEAMKRIAELEARDPVIVDVEGPPVVVREVYVDNPEHIKAIEVLQEALRECRSTSQ